MTDPARPDVEESMERLAVAFSPPPENKKIFRRSALVVQDRPSSSFEALALLGSVHLNLHVK